MSERTFIIWLIVVTIVVSVGVVLAFGLVCGAGMSFGMAYMLLVSVAFRKLVKEDDYGR